MSALSDVGWAATVVAALVALVAPALSIARAAAVAREHPQERTGPWLVAAGVSVSSVVCAGLLALQVRTLVAAAMSAAFVEPSERALVLELHAPPAPLGAMLVAAALGIVLVAVGARRSPRAAPPQRELLGVAALGALVAVVCAIVLGCDVAALAPG